MSAGDTPGPDATAPVRPETVFAGRYRLLEKLGSGGFGTVYRAHDTHLRIEVALKVTNAAVIEPEVLHRFEREARVIAKLTHENIVKIFDFGVHEGLPFYTMEFITGDTLQKVMEVNRFLPLRAAARIARDVALALHHAHINGIVHRDVKPHNIIVQPRQAEASVEKPRADRASSFSTSKGVLSEYRVVLTDFGLAKDRAAMTKLSTTGEVMGTPHYMPPEQAMGESGAVGPPSDVYSLGVVLYFMLTGRLPFGGDSAPEILYNIVSTDPTPLRKVGPHLPDDICVIAHKAMERDPRLRYGSALAFAEDCENFLKGESISAKPPGLVVRARRFVRKHLAACASVASALLVGLLVLSTFALILPAMRARAARREYESRERVFLAEKAKIEDGAGRLLVEAQERYEAKEFERVAGLAERLVREYEPYALRKTFPAAFKARVPWDERFSDSIPFRIPLVQTYLLAARAGERRVKKTEAMRFYLKAYFAWIDLAKAGDGDLPNALYELAHFHLRTGDYDQAIHFFRKLVDGPPSRHSDWARHALAFAYCGAGRYELAAGAFDDLLKRPLASRPPAHPEFFETEGLVPMFELEPTREVIAEAADLCGMFAWKTDVAPLEDLGSVTVADLDGDGAEEILVGVDGGVDVYAHVDRKMRKTRTLKAPGLGRSKPTPADLDGDRRPELIVPAGNGFDVYRIEGDVLVKIDAGTWTPISRVDGCREVLAVDLDTCGRPEIVVVSHQRVRIFKHDGRSYVESGLMRFPSTDPFGIHSIDLDRDGTPELLFLTGTWASEYGFRIWVCRMDRADGKLSVAERPVGWTSTVPFPAVAGGPGEKGTTFVLTTTCAGGVRRTLRQVYERMGVEPDFGLIRVTYSDGTFGAPELLWGRRDKEFADHSTGSIPIRTHGKNYLLAHVETQNDRRLINLSAPRWHYLPLRGELVHVLPGDLDGDGDAELVACSGKRLVVFGLPGKGRVERDSGETARRHPQNERAIAFQDATLTLSAYLQDRRYEEALDFLKDAERMFPEFEKDLLLSTARINQKMYRWKELGDTLTRIKSTFFLAGPEAQEIDQWMQWSREMLSMRRQVEIDFGKAGPLPLLTNAPLKFRLDRKRGILTAYSNCQSLAFLAMPFRSDENSYVLSCRLRVDRLDYVNSFALGMSNSFDRAEGENMYTMIFRGWGRFVAFSTGGMGGLPSTMILQAAQEVATGAGARSRSDIAISPGPHWFRVSSQYVRGADLLRGIFEKESDAGTVPLGEFETPWTYRNPPQDCILAITTGTKAFVGDEYWGEVEVAGVVVESAGEMALGRFEPESLPERFVRAGGRFVNQDYAGALEDYATVLRMIDDGRLRGGKLFGELSEEEVRREVAFITAFAHLHLGQHADAEARLMSVFDTGLDKALFLLRRNYVGMTDSEQALFRKIFWRVMGDTDLENAVNRSLVHLRAQAHAVLAILEVLFFTDPKDPSAAWRVASSLERQVAGSGQCAAIVLRSKARILKADGHHAEALERLREALRAAEQKDVDEYDRYPLERSIESLLEAWKK